MSSYHLMSSKENLIHVDMCLFNIGKFRRSEKLTWYKTRRCSCGKVGPWQPSPSSLLEDLLHMLFVVCLAGLQANMGIYRSKEWGVNVFSHYSATSFSALSSWEVSLGGKFQTCRHSCTKNTLEGLFVGLEQPNCNSPGGKNFQLHVLVHRRVC